MVVVGGGGGTTTSLYSQNCVIYVKDLGTVTDSDLMTTMGYLRMDGKRGHVTCGNRLAIERQESFQKFASLEEELLLCSVLLGPCKISHCSIWGKMTPAR